MATSSRYMLPITLVISVFIVSLSQTCLNYKFTRNVIFHSCTDLPQLHSHLYWNYSPFTAKVSIAYRANVTSTGWIAWGINPNRTGMIGSQAIVAFHNSIGGITVYPTAITSYRPSMVPGPLSFQVSNISAEYVNNEMIVFAVVGPLFDASSVNHVWQSGSSVLGNTPQMHPIALSNLQAMGKVDFTLGANGT